MLYGCYLSMHIWFDYLWFPSMNRGFSRLSLSCNGIICSCLFLLHNCMIFGFGRPILGLFLLCYNIISTFVMLILWMLVSAPWCSTFLHRIDISTFLHRIDISFIFYFCCAQDGSIIIVATGAFVASFLHQATTTSSLHFLHFLSNLILFHILHWYYFGFLGNGGTSYSFALMGLFYPVIAYYINSSYELHSYQCTSLHTLSYLATSIEASPVSLALQATRSLLFSNTICTGSPRVLQS